MTFFERYKPAFLALAIFANGYISYRGVEKYIESKNNEELFTGFIFGVSTLVLIFDLYFFYSRKKLKQAEDTDQNLANENS